MLAYVCGCALHTAARVRLELGGMWALPWPDISTLNRDPMYKKSWPKEFSLSARLMLLLSGIRHTAAPEWNGMDRLDQRTTVPTPQPSLFGGVSRSLLLQYARTETLTYILLHFAMFLLVCLWHSIRLELSDPAFLLWILILNYCFYVYCSFSWRELFSNTKLWVTEDNNGWILNTVSMGTINQYI